MGRTAASMAAFSESQFGEYFLHDRIGAGGMAEIFLATSRGIEGFEKRLVIKRILPTLSDDEQFVRMFIEEAKLCVALRHPNIVQVYDLGQIDQQFFIAMEYVDGRDLLKTLAACGRKRVGFPTDIALYIVMEVLKGLDYAHNLRRPDGRPLNIIHRDVSPSNVLLSFEGEVKIGDFGIAKASTREKTATGILKGKFGYMAPEQVTGAPIDHRADIFAIGIMLYELLTGHRLFAGKNDLAVLEKVRDARVEPPPRFYRPDLDSDIEAITLKALSRAPADRFQSAVALHDAVHDYVYRSRAMIGPNDLARFMQTLFLSDPEEIERRRRARLPPVPLAAPRPPAPHLRPAVARGRGGGSFPTDPPTPSEVARTPLVDLEPARDPPSKLSGHYAVVDALEEWSRHGTEQELDEPDAGEVRRGHGHPPRDAHQISDARPLISPKQFDGPLASEEQTTKTDATIGLGFGASSGRGPAGWPGSRDGPLRAGAEGHWSGEFSTIDAVTREALEAANMVAPDEHETSERPMSSPQGARGPRSTPEPPSDRETETEDPETEERAMRTASDRETEERAIRPPSEGDTDEPMPPMTSQGSRPGGRTQSSSDRETEEHVPAESTKPRSPSETPVSSRERPTPRDHGPPSQNNIGRESAHGDDTDFPTAQVEEVIFDFSDPAEHVLRGDMVSEVAQFASAVSLPLEAIAPAASVIDAVVAPVDSLLDDTTEDRPEDLRVRVREQLGALESSSEKVPGDTAHDPLSPSAFFEAATDDASKCFEDFTEEQEEPRGRSEASDEPAQAIRPPESSLPDRRTASATSRPRTPPPRPRRPLTPRRAYDGSDAETPDASQPRLMWASGARGRAEGEPKSAFGAAKRESRPRHASEGVILFADDDSSEDAPSFDSVPRITGPGQLMVRAEELSGALQALDGSSFTAGFSPDEEISSETDSPRLAAKSGSAPSSVPAGRRTSEPSVTSDERRGATFSDETPPTSSQTGAPGVRIPRGQEIGADEASDSEREAPMEFELEHWPSERTYEHAEEATDLARDASGPRGDGGVLHRGLGAPPVRRESSTGEDASRSIVDHDLIPPPTPSEIDAPRAVDRPSMRDVVQRGRAVREVHRGPVAPEAEPNTIPPVQTTPPVQTVPMQRTAPQKRGKNLGRAERPGAAEVSVLASKTASRLVVVLVMLAVALAVATAVVLFRSGQNESITIRPSGGPGATERESLGTLGQEDPAARSPVTTGTTDRDGAAPESTSDGADGADGAKSAAAVVLDAAMDTQDDGAKTRDSAVNGEDDAGDAGAGSDTQNVASAQPRDGGEARIDAASKAEPPTPGRATRPSVTEDGAFIRVVCDRPTDLRIRGPVTERWVGVRHQSIRVAPGRYQIQLSRRRRVLRSRTVVLEAGEDVKVTCP